MAGKKFFGKNKRELGGKYGRMLRICSSRVTECDNSVDMCSDNNFNNNNNGINNNNRTTNTNFNL